MFYVVQVVTLCCLSFFIVHKLFQVIFPFLGCSSCFSLRSCRYDESWVPLGGSSGPSVWALGGVALLFMYLIQSNSSSWLNVLSQFLSMSGERGPGTADPVLHLGFLIHGCDHLP